MGPSKRLLLLLVVTCLLFVANGFSSEAYADEAITSRRTEIRGAKLHYMTAGHGPTLILLPAMPRPKQGVEFMINVTRKWWLGPALLFCLVPSSLALQKFSDRPKDDKCKPGDKCKQQVPEGGTAVVYLLGAGLTCLGAMYVRARSSKPSLS